MTHRSTTLLLTAIVAGSALIACESGTDPAATLDETTITNDVAASAGDAIATSVETMVGNEVAGSLTNVVAGDLIEPAIVSTNRTRTCYDANGAVVTNCTPLSSVRKIVTQASLDGSRGRTDTVNSKVRSFSGAVHRVLNDTLVRVFTGTTETSRVHSGVATANDTTTFTEGDITRKAVESAVDSIKSVTWSVPRSANQYPISGSIVRVATGSITLTRGDKTDTRQFSRTVTVTFPPDQQGNVTLTVNGKSCTLNLGTHKVSCP